MNAARLIQERDGSVDEAGRSKEGLLPWWGATSEQATRSDPRLARHPHTACLQAMPCTPPLPLAHTCASCRRPQENRISELPPTIGSCVSLTELYVGFNALTTLPDEIAGCQALKTLDVR
eukprot:146845-Chlamydomonas_euryale.AAC.7